MNIIRIKWWLNKKIFFKQKMKKFITCPTNISKIKIPSAHQSTAFE